MRKDQEIFRSEYRVHGFSGNIGNAKYTTATLTTILQDFFQSV